MTCASRIFDSHKFTRCPLPSNTFPCNFLLIFCIGWKHTHSSFLLFICTIPAQYKAGCFCIPKSFSRFFGEILSFGFCLVNSECDAYPPVDHSLVYGHPKILILFSSLVLNLAGNHVSDGSIYNHGQNT